MKNLLKKLSVMAILFGIVCTTMGASSSVIYNRTTRNVSPTDLNITAASVTTPAFTVTDMDVENAYVTNVVVVDKMIFLSDVTFTDTTETQDRLFIRKDAKALTDASAVSLFSLTSRTNSFIVGTIEYGVFCQDASFETQVVGGIVTFSGVNTNGVWATLNITENASNQSKSVTSGTIVPTWSLTAADAPNASTNATVKVSVDTSLTPAANQFYIRWQVRNNGTNVVTGL